MARARGPDDLRPLARWLAPIWLMARARVTNGLALLSCYAFCAYCAGSVRCTSCACCILCLQRSLLLILYLCALQFSTSC